MNIFVRNSSIYFVPIYVINEKYYLDPNVILFLILYVILMVVCAFMTYHFSAIIHGVQVFHPNMNTIISTLIYQWYETTFAKFVILPYQLGIITIGDSDKVFSFWLSYDPTEMPSSSNLDLVPMFVSGFLILHYGFTVVFSVFIVTCERAFATYFIKDYEKKQRTYIRTSLLFSTHLITLIMAYMSVNMTLNFGVGVSVSAIVIVSAFMIYLFILRYNRKIQKRLDEHDNGSIYSLAIRFQAKENARSLELARRLVTFASICLLVGIVLITVAVYGFADSHLALLFLACESAFYLNPLMVIPVALSSVPVWRDRFLERMPILNRLRVTEVFRAPKVSVVNTHRESEVYFNQLSEMWK